MSIIRTPQLFNSARSWPNVQTLRDKHLDYLFEMLRLANKPKSSDKLLKFNHIAVIPNQNEEKATQSVYFLLLRIL